MMFKAGINPIEILLWSRGKRLDEVLQEINKIRAKTDSSVLYDESYFSLDPLSSGTLTFYNIY